MSSLDTILRDKRFDQTLNEIMNAIGLMAHPRSDISIKALEQYIQLVNNIKHNEAKIQGPEKIHELQQHSSGSKLDAATFFIRLIYHSQLRTLQTRINELICQIQKITANPKCDLNLGRTGR